MRIFLDDIDYRCFVQILGVAAEEHRIECWSYCVMPNHYHLVVFPTRANLSQGLADINGDYAQWWNRRHGRVGHAFQGPFKDQIVQGEGYLPTLLRYVARNPVKANLVDRPEDWQWSSYAATVGLVPAPDFLMVGRVLEQFGEGDTRRLQERYATFVLGDHEERDIVARIRKRSRILGDAAFRRAVRTRQERGLTPR